jgi:hypothetical protein
LAARSTVPDGLLRLDPLLPGVFELHGWDDVPDRLHELQAKGDIAGMAETITDEMLDEFTITSTWNGLADAIRARYEGVADQVIAYSSLRGWAGDPSALERWSAVARAING